MCKHVCTAPLDNTNDKVVLSFKKEREIHTHTKKKNVFRQKTFEFARLVSLTLTDWKQQGQTPRISGCMSLCFHQGFLSKKKKKCLKQFQDQN